MKETSSIVFAGMLSAISSIGRIFFNEQIASINYGINGKSRIIVSYNEIRDLKKSIFFVFFTTDPNLPLRRVRAFSAKVFIQTKSLLTSKNPDLNRIKTKVDKIILSDGDFFG